MPAHGLPPERKLRRRGEFQRVFDHGRRLHGRYFTIVAAPSEQPTIRLGIVASRKIGGAVVRNRAKRLIRELFRRSTPVEGSWDFVVIPKSTLVAADLVTLEQEYKATLRRCLSKK